MYDIFRITRRVNLLRFLVVWQVSLVSLQVFATKTQIPPDLLAALEDTSVEGQDIVVEMDPDGEIVSAQVVPEANEPFDASEPIEDPGRSNPEGKVEKVGLLHRSATATATFLINGSLGAALSTVAGAPDWENILVRSVVFGSLSALFRFFYPEYQYLSSGNIIKDGIPERAPLVYEEFHLSQIPERARYHIGQHLRRQSLKYGMGMGAIAECLYLGAATWMIQVYYVQVVDRQNPVLDDFWTQENLMHHLLSIFAYVGIDSGVAKFTKFEIDRRAKSGRANRVTQVISDWFAVGFSALHTGVNTAFKVQPLYGGVVYAGMGLIGVFLAKIAGAGDEKMADFIDTNLMRYDVIRFGLARQKDRLVKSCRGFFSRKS